MLLTRDSMSSSDLVLENWIRSCLSCSFTVNDNAISSFFFIFCISTLNLSGINPGLARFKMLLEPLFKQK